MSLMFEDCFIVTVMNTCYTERLLVQCSVSEWLGPRALSVGSLEPFEVQARRRRAKMNKSLFLYSHYLFIYSSSIIMCHALINKNTKGNEYSTRNSLTYILQSSHFSNKAWLVDLKQ